LALTFEWNHKSTKHEKIAGASSVIGSLTVGKSGSVANFGKLRIHALRRTQLSSERRELLECGLARRLELSLADHVRDFDAFQWCRG
jgi:hypothetical protein